MPQENDNSSLRLFTSRGGTVTEVISFLQDIEASYNKLYLFYNALDYFDLRGRRIRYFFLDDFAIPTSPFFISEMSSENILPEDRLIIQQIQISSPGFWEFLGALNPLQQIREYLNDRHKRRQDKEYREKSEKDKLDLENRLIEQQVIDKENSNLRGRIAILKELGFSNREIRSLIWSNVGKPLVTLAKHQDTGLIEGADIIIRNDKQ